MMLLVKDAAGATQTVETLPPKGQAVVAQSLPVAIATEQLAAIFAALGTVAASSGPLAGNAAASAILGPFTPQLAREIVVTLSGVWTGSVALKRSIDGGATKLPCTLGGQPVVWTSNLQEQVWVETEAGATLYLDFGRTSGTLTYRIAQ